MNERPAFFERIRNNAVSRWEQLERDPELHSVWQLAFSLVQSPRHVLSELLQNADDAKAGEVSVQIENGVFLFEHNGADFEEQHFESLCRLGYSNKRILHTIGFRGIGFKSTFSLGSCVELITPSLSVRFNSQRFTEPHWLDGPLRSDGKTCIRVAIDTVEGEDRPRELEHNLREWQTSPMSLLFCNHIRAMRIGGSEIAWRRVADGPIPCSAWMQLPNDSKPLLVIRSQDEAFPEEALKEVRKERMLSAGAELDFPPCKIEVVLGGDGRLFVVLPTRVKTSLPVACNAPFVQEPARTDIKDPRESPTNRWLLRRVGALIAEALLAWLGAPDIEDVERARAYDLFPDMRSEDYSLAGTCAAIVKESFAEAIKGKPYLWTDDNLLVGAKECVVVPESLCNVWPSSQVADLFDEAKRPAFSQLVSQSNWQKLVVFGVLDEITDTDVLDKLWNKSFPKPATYENLFSLWGFFAVKINLYALPWYTEFINIVPVEGRDMLQAATNVVRLGSKNILESESDNGFLAEHLLVLDTGWTQYLAERQKDAEKSEKQHDKESFYKVNQVLKALKLDGSSDVYKAIDRVAASLHAHSSASNAGWVRLARIAAKMNATVRENFRYVTRDGVLRAPKTYEIFDGEEFDEELIPESLRDAHLLHSDYTYNSASCTQEEWRQWVKSKSSGIAGLPALVEKKSEFSSRSEIEAELRRRGAKEKPTYPYYSKDHFRIKEWDFSDDYIDHWSKLAKSDNCIWAMIAKKIATHLATLPKDCYFAEAVQISNKKTEKQIVSEPLPSSWVLRFRETPCLRDTRGLIRKPGDLLRRTAQTEYLIEVESFIDRSLDTANTSKFLELLGVASAPPGPDRLLASLGALAQCDTPPTDEVERCYSRLDRMVHTCSQDDVEKIKNAFFTSKFIYTEKQRWATASSVFISSDENDVPGADIIRDSVRGLSLWRKIGVAARPTVELVIQWLKGLSHGEKLSSDDMSRVKSLLTQYHIRIWHECHSWINLMGEWTDVDRLSFTLSNAVDFAWEHLDERVKAKTADLRQLPIELAGFSPFTELPMISSRVEDRLNRELDVTDARLEEQSWLTAFGTNMCRIELKSDAETIRVSELAKRLAETRCLHTPKIEVMPYIDGMPAGTPRRADILWLNTVLYVTKLPAGKLAKRVPEEIAKEFDLPEIKDALHYSFQRPAEDIRRYLEENFTLVPVDNVPTLDSADDLQVVNTGDAPQDVASDSVATLVNAAEKQAGVSPAGSVLLEETSAGLAVDSNSQKADVSSGVALTSDVQHADGQDAGMVALWIPQGNPSAIARPLDADASIAGQSVNQIGNADMDAGGGEENSGPRNKQREPMVIEKFAVAQGFQMDGNGQFVHPNGCRIIKTTGDIFPWGRMDASGNVVRYYLPKEHCLHTAPLVIESEVCGLIDDKPEKYALILLDVSGKPKEMTGTLLLQLKKQQRLNIYTAAYRLLLNDDNKS